MTRMLNLHFIVFVTLAVVSLRRKASVIEAASCEQDLDSKAAFCSGQGLRSVPTDLQPNLLELYLQDNLLTTLRNGTFSMYPSLRVIFIVNNNISHIDTGAFTPLENLFKLSIDHNSFLPPIHASMFSSLIISDISASYSNLKSFAGDIIKTLQNSAYVYLSDNKLRAINWTSTRQLSYVNLNYNRFRHISNDNFVLKSYVRTLRMSGNPIVLIDASVISSLHVKELDLSDTHLANSQWSNLFGGIRMSSISVLEWSDPELHAIEPGFFAPLKGKNLDELNILFRKINVFPDHAFSDLTGVSSFLLNDRDLQRVEPIQFNGMTSLRSLSLKKNEITVINSQGGAWNLSLTQLTLAFTELTEINSSSFQGLTTLKKLDLSQNFKLNVIGDDTFANLPFLEELDLSGNNIKQHVSGIQHLHFLRILTIKHGRCPSLWIQPGYLGRATPSLVNLNLSNSKIAYLMLWDSLTNTSSFSGLHSLLRLDLSYNVMNALSRDVFSNLTNLQRLNLRHSFISDLQAGIFRDLENLLLLNLEDNSLSTLSPHIFDQMINLQRLYLKENQLTHLDSDLLKYCSGLRHLDISYNSITSLNRSMFEPLSNLTELKAASNPLVCNCDLKWFAGWVKDSIHVTGSCLDSLSTLKAFRGKELVTFDPGEECDQDIVLYACLPLLGLALILTLGLIYYQRYWIRYRLFLLKICCIGYEEIQDGVDRREFQYDLAIMHHEADNDWVNGNMRPVLAERVPDFDRIVCGDEELMLGMYYLDAVHYATEQSFKTIVIISREALQDQWFIMKFRTVLDHVNDVGTEKMILLFVEDIPGDELPFLIRLFLSDHRPYLVWPDDERGQNYFWEELIKDLTVNIRCNHLVPP